MEWCGGVHDVVHDVAVDVVDDVVQFSLDRHRHSHAHVVNDDVQQLIDVVDDVANVVRDIERHSKPIGWGHSRPCHHVVNVVVGRLVNVVSDMYMSLMTSNEMVSTWGLVRSR